MSYMLSCSMIAKSVRQLSTKNQMTCKLTMVDNTPSLMIKTNRQYYITACSFKVPEIKCTF